MSQLLTLWGEKLRSTRNDLKSPTREKILRILFFGAAASSSSSSITYSSSEF